MSNTIWCFLAGGVDVFPVDIDQAKTVGHLKAEIKEQKPHRLNHIDADDLTLYRVEIESSHTTKQIIAQLNQLLQNLNKGDALNARQTLSAAFGGSPPGKEYFALVHLPPTEHKRKRSDESDEIQRTDIKPELVFRSRKRGTDHFTEDTLTENHIQHQTVNPKFVCDILAKLQTKKFTTTEQQGVLKWRIKEHEIIAEHFNLVTENDNLVTENDSRCSDHELSHLVYLFAKNVGLSSLDKGPVKYRVANGDFQHLATYLYERYLHRADFKREAYWPLKFVAKIIDENNKCYSYEPRSDFLFSVDDCPRISIEVCSDPRHESDRYRLLLQAGLLVRTMNTIEPEGSSFISIAIYISNHHSAELYLVYQPDRADTKIEYTKKDFNLKLPLDRLEFFRQLYNFPSAFPLDDKNTSVKGRLAGLKSDVDAKKLDGFTVRTTKRPKTEKAAPTGEGHTHHLNNPSTSQLLSRAGYQLLPEIQVEGWSPVNPLPSTVCRARGLANKNGRVVKKVIFKFVEQDEFDIHLFLLERKLSGGHIVPILESFTCPCGLGKLIAMKEDLVLHNASPRLLETAGHSLALQFLEGVRFIHDNLVAHLDLKPANIVIGAKNELSIIDLGVSVRVPLLESRISGYQGTKGWVAPEVEQNPDAGYEPIRADLWSTGQVLRYLAEHHPAYHSEMIFLADQLQNSEPQQRPLLSTNIHTLFQRPFRYHENLPLTLKRKLGVDAPGKGGVKRQPSPMRYVTSIF